MTTDKAQNTEYLKYRLSQVCTDITDLQTERFQRYYEMLVDWNTRMNLTAITEYEDVVSKHFMDSLAVMMLRNVSRETFCRLFRIPDVSRETSDTVSDEKVSRETSVKLIDVGTGAGFPGIPLKIAMPELEVTLLDSLNKRIGFLDEVIRELELKGIRTVHARAEDGASDPAYREQYDLCVSRAVASLPVLMEYCLPYVRQGGYFAAYKSGNIDAELKISENALKVLGGTIEKIVLLTLPGTDISRSLVIIRKTGRTPKKYPRKAGTPSKNPL